MLWFRHASGDPLAVCAVATAQPQAGGDAAAAKAQKREAEKQRRAGKGNLVGHGGPIKALAADAAACVSLRSFDFAPHFFACDFAGD